MKSKKILEVSLEKSIQANGQRCYTKMLDSISLILEYHLKYYSYHYASVLNLL